MPDAYTDEQVLQSLSESFDELSDTIRSSARQSESMVAAMSSFWDDEVMKSFRKRTFNHLEALDEVAQILTEVSSSLADQAVAARVYLEDDY